MISTDLESTLVARHPEPPLDSAEMPNAAELEDLFRKFFRPVWNLARRLGVPSDSVDDVAQEVFITASVKLDRIEPGKEKAFLLGITVRLSANARRSRATERNWRAFDCPTLSAASGPPTDELLEWKRARELLDVVLDEMPAQLRTVFVLFELEALSTAEIAELTGQPSGTVASRLRRARELYSASVQRLRSRLSFQGEKR